MTYPITPYLEQICSELKNSLTRFLILTAETAAGKSTVFPLSLLKNFSGKIIMTEPRRIAVLGVANRLAELSEEEKNPIGYKIHLENKITEDTRLEVVTEAILVRQLQSDPALEDYNVVVLDEFHERSVNTDLALAFLKEAMQLREDLFVVIMSATIDTKKLQNYLGEETPIINIPGKLFSVKIIYEPNLSISAAVRKALSFNKIPQGNILVFLPSLSDIRNAQQELLETGEFDEDSNVEICILHSSISLEEQKRIIRPPAEGEAAKRRVILSSAIAETSLTVPGITVVIDSGLSRINRIDLSSGMEKLFSETESEFSARQRSGRAGRLCEGYCIRLWNMHDPRVKELEPEILRTDLAPLVLECSERGVYSPEGIDWLDKPSSAAWKTCSILLRQLGLIREDGHLTEKGRSALTLGLHPRLASIALESYNKETKQLSREGAAYLIKFSNYSKSHFSIQNKFIADIEHRLSFCKYTGDGYPEFLMLCGYPDRIAKRISEIGIEPAEYQFTGGKKALYYAENKNAPLWIVAPTIYITAAKNVIMNFAELPEAKIEQFLEKNSEIHEFLEFTQGTLQKFSQKCYGAFILSSTRIPTDSDDLAEFWVQEIKEKGIECLPKNERVDSLLLRAEFIEQEKNSSASAEKIHDDFYRRLTDNVREWLVPFLKVISALTPAEVYESLYWYLNGSEIDKLAPEELVLENGRRCKVKYERQAEIKPVIEIIIQRIFGCFTTPQICGKKVLLRLLSPASRPLQVTEDLEHFWTGVWPEICKEMKGRYPKHNWEFSAKDNI